MVATTAPPVLVPAVAYLPLPNEVEPAIKEAAAAVVQRLFSYRLGEGTKSGAESRLRGLPASQEVVARGEPLFSPTVAQEADIVYPQLGGLAGGKASVMTVTRLRSMGRGGIDQVTRTIDVRLELQNAAWVVVDIASLGGDAFQRPASLSEPSNRVLDHRQIDLPDSARWDIYAGRIDDRVLRTLADIADQQPVAVTVLSTGHPLDVFGSQHVSNHIPGRGVDIWKIGAPVVELRSRESTLGPLVGRLLAAGVTELGAPFDIDGPGGANFANVVHQDHLHVAFDK